ncbi:MULTISPECIES: hypothetical protein [unclassified Delftia]|uniref:hypothetical protein n=1 Tax=unclassified Delftia TaxID=2613839 RepID=UPI00115497A6|nr:MULTISPECIES: hypothetical protein [unclassified Delftia]MCB4787471.1 hypothetical protein [Delftia sp. Lp-1]
MEGSNTAVNRSFINAVLVAIRVMQGDALPSSEQMLVRRLLLKPKAKKVSLGYLGQPTDFSLSINHVLDPVP